MHQSTHISGAGNGSQLDYKLDYNAIQTRKLSQYIARNAGKSIWRHLFLRVIFLNLNISFVVYLRTMSSKNVSKTFSFVPDVKRTLRYGMVNLYYGYLGRDRLGWVRHISLQIRIVKLQRHYGEKLRAQSVVVQSFYWQKCHPSRKQESYSVFVIRWTTLMMTNFCCFTLATNHKT